MAPQLIGLRSGQGNSVTADGVTMNNFFYPLPDKIAAGATIFLAMHTDNANVVSTISDNINGSWSTTPDVTVTGANQTLALYKFSNSGAADPTTGNGLKVKVVFTGTVNPPITWLQAWSGIQTSGTPLDGTKTAASQALTGNGTVAVAAYTPTHNNDPNGGHLILTFASVDNFAGSNPALSNIAASGTGLTLQSAGIDWPTGAGTAPKASSAGIQAANGSITPGFTLTGNNAGDNWNIISAAYLVDNTQGTPPSGTFVSSGDFHFVSGLAAAAVWHIQSPLQGGDFPTFIGTNNTAASVNDSQGITWTLDPGDSAPPTDTVGQVWYPSSKPTTPDGAYKINLTMSSSPPAQVHGWVLHLRGVSGKIGQHAFQTAPVAGAVVQHDPDIGGAGAASLTAGSIVVLAGPAGIGPVLGLSNPVSAVLMSAFIQVDNDDANTENSGDGWGWFRVTPTMVGVTQNVSWQMGTSFTGKIDNGAGVAGTTLTVTSPVGPLIGISSATGQIGDVGGAGVTTGTFTNAFGTGTGGAGTYTVNNSQLTPATGTEAMTTGPVGGGPQAHAVEFLPVPADIPSQFNKGFYYPGWKPLRALFQNSDPNAPAQAVQPETNTFFVPRSFPLQWNLNRQLFRTTAQDFSSLGVETNPHWQGRTWAVQWTPLRALMQNSDPNAPFAQPDNPTYFTPRMQPMPWKPMPMGRTAAQDFSSFGVETNPHWWGRIFPLQWNIKRDWAPPQDSSSFGVETNPHWTGRQWPVPWNLTPKLRQTDPQDVSSFGVETNVHYITRTWPFQWNVQQSLMRGTPQDFSSTPPIVVGYHILTPMGARLITPIGI